MMWKHWSNYPWENKKVQNRCLRKITGAYKRTPRAVLEREASIPPIDLYMRATSLKYGAATKGNMVTVDIAKHVGSLWNSMRQIRGRKANTRRKNTAMEEVREEADQVICEMREKSQYGSKS